MKKLLLTLLLPLTGWGQFNPIFFSGNKTVQSLLYTQQFDDAYWKKDQTPDIVVVPDVINAPNATLTADKFYNSAVLPRAILMYESSYRVAAGQRYTISIYAKAGIHGIFQLCGRGTPFGNEVYANFNLSSGLVTKKGTGTLAVMQLDNNGWYRCAISGVTTTGSIGAVTFGVVAGINSIRQGDASSLDEVYVWGVKIQLGGTATEYKNEFTQVIYTGASPITPI